MFCLKHYSQDRGRGEHFGGFVLQSFEPGVCFKQGRFHDTMINTATKIKRKKHTKQHIPPGIHAFGAIFAFYNGQDIERMERYVNDYDSFDEDEHLDEHLDYQALGIIGGHFVYERAVSMFLIPPVIAQHMEEYDPLTTPTQKCIAVNGYARNRRHDLNRKIHLNCSNGQIYLSNTILRHEDYENGFDDPYPNPEDLPISKNSENDEYDSGLVWMENLADKFDNGEIDVATCIVGGEGDEFSKAIVHYPTIKCQHQFYNYENRSTSASSTTTTTTTTAHTTTSDALPIVSHAITNGIEVIASSHHDPLNKDYVSYSIRIKILGKNDEGYLTETERGYKTCQLLSRHWIIVCDDNGREETVDGEGVVGLHPLLYEGGKYRNDMFYGKGKMMKYEDCFRYSSYVNASSKSFRGQLKFVPGSLKKPTGDPFFVDLAPFAIVTKTEFVY